MTYKAKPEHLSVYPSHEEPLPRGYSDMPLVIVLLVAWILALPVVWGLVELIKHYNR